MNPHDPLESLLREWKAPEPAPEVDRDLLVAYRSAVVPQVPSWRRFFSMRVSIPAPALLVAAIAIAALVVWLRRPAPAASTPETHGIITQLNARGFQPLPDGEARIIRTAEVPR